VAVALQWPVNKFPEQRTRDATIEELLEAVFPTKSVLMQNMEGKQQFSSKHLTKANHFIRDMSIFSSDRM
jgi:hypothetical protein